jgi:hypothetical protein
VLLQIFILINSVFLALAIPIGQWHLDNRLVRTWVVTVSIFLTTTLPAVLPMFALREFGSQNKIRQVLYGAVALLLLATLVLTASSWKP